MPTNQSDYESSLIGLAKNYGNYYADLDPKFGVETWKYIIDAETYEMLLVQGRKGEDVYEGEGNWHGHTCYKYLLGQDSPCEDCHARKAGRDNYAITLKTDEHTGKKHFVENLIIEHNGRPAILEKIIDVNDVDYRDKVMNEYISTKNLSDKVLGILMEETHIMENFELACQEICEYFDADRALITEYCLGKLNTTWAKIPQPFTQVCVELSDATIAELTKITENLNYIWVPDVENADKLDQGLRKYWTSGGIRSILLIPMHYNGSFLGTVSLHNIKEHFNMIDTLKLLGMAVAKCIHAYVADAKAEIQSYVDSLTGALNLTGFKRRAYELLREKPETRYYFCSMDIRYFGGINRRYGFALGDRILIQAAEMLNKNMAEDELFCRISADVFCLLLKYSEKENIQERFRKFAESMQCFEELKAADYEIEFQCGAYIHDNKDTSIAQAIDRANLARLSLKDEPGSSMLIFSNELLEKDRRETELLQDFKSALLHGELSVHFQPQCNYSSRKIVGAEALVRWKSPKHGNVSPADFIPLLEKHGLIHELDLFVWEEVCRYQQKWISMGIECPISVNVSRHDVLGNNICSELCGLLEKYQIPKSLFPLEITETAYIKNSEELISSVEMLKDAGFKMEMDDFGSGYSSLNALKDVSVDLLKLDMKFLDMGDKAGRGGSILNCIVRMTRWLDLGVLAEGVETKEQAEYLKSIGCDLMQGFYFARPMPAEDFEWMLMTNGTIGEDEKGYESLDSDRFVESLVANPLLFNNIGAAAIAEDCDGVTEVFMVNDSFLEMLDMSREEFLPYMKDIRTALGEIVPEAEMLRIYIDPTDGTRVRECPIKRKDGTVRKVRINSRTLLEGKDRSILLICLTDISELLTK